MCHFSTLLVVSLSSSTVVYTLKGGRKSYVLLQTPSAHELDEMCLQLPVSG